MNKQNKRKKGAIDIGLSVRWAKNNLGADNPCEIGNYYSWGDKKPIESRKGHYQLHTLNTTDKIVKQKLGEGWHIPTKKQWAELLHCKWKIKYINGNAVYKVTGPNGRSIILPITGRKSYASFVEYPNTMGYYWTRTRSLKAHPSLDNKTGYCAIFSTQYKTRTFTFMEKAVAIPIRPVYQ